VLIGPLFKGKNLLKERLKGLKNFSYIENLELADIVERYDLAVCSFGLTVYELACCGVPALIVPATDELDTIAEEFVRYGSAEKVNLNANPSQILHATKKICFDFNLRKEMSRQGKALVDGKGAERVANILIKFL
jgi:spore coat polysaccharide biosynthesis predicted glycosyltransferase SpsG